MKLISLQNNILEKTGIFFLSLLYISAAISSINPDIFSANTALLMRHSVTLVSIMYFLSIYAFRIIKNNNIIKIYRPNSSINSVLLFLWFLLSVSIIISQIYSEILPTEGIGFLLFIPFFLFLIVPITFNNPLIAILKATLYSGLFYVILSFIYNPEILNFSSYLGYMGVMGNSNNMGLIALQVGISSAFFIFENTDSKKNIIYYIYLSTSIFLIFITKSRTALISIIIVFLLLIMVNILLEKINIKNLILPVSVMIVVYFLFLDEYFVETIGTKINLSQDNPLSGRADIWRIVINQASLFGYGSNYFQEVINLDGHNSIISFLGNYGVISALLLIGVFIFSIVSSSKLWINNRDKNFYIAFIIITVFILLNMTESMIGLFPKPLTLIFYNLLGVLIFNKNFNEESTSYNNYILKKEKK